MLSSGINYFVILDMPSKSGLKFTDNYSSFILIIFTSLDSFTHIIKSSCLYRLSQKFRNSHGAQLFNKGFSVPLMISYVFDLCFRK